MKLFQATVESVLLYGSETWTVTNKIGKSLDGCYTRMLRRALDVSWKDHITNEELYGDLPKITTRISKRRLQFAGNCKRSEGKIISELVTWRSTQGREISRTTNQNFCGPASSRHRLHHPWDWSMHAGQTVVETMIIGVRQKTPEWVSEWVRPT